MKKIILASQSPRRKELLQQLVPEFEVFPADIDETITPGMTPKEYVLTMAKEKAQVIFKAYPEAVVIGCDTIVVLDDEILGKPQTAADAKAMLMRYDNRQHDVLTGVCLMSKEKQVVELAKATVFFYPLDEKQVDAYVASQDPMDKAGAYGIQSGAARFIKSMTGDYYAIVGFPVGLVNQLLQSFIK